VQPFVAQAISPAIQEKLAAINLQIEVIRNILDEIAKQPEAVRNAAAAFKTSQQQKIDALYAESGRLLGNAIRLRGGNGTVGQTMRFKLTLRLQSTTVVRRVKTKIEFDAAAFDFLAAGTGADAAEQPLVAPVAGGIMLAVDEVSRGAALAEGEYEVATLDLGVKSASPSSQSVRISQPQVTTDPQTEFRALDGLAFLSP
jgi:hypothetical protein